MVRRLGAAYNWFDERTAIRSLLRKGLYEAVPVRGAWFYTLGSATLVSTSGGSSKSFEARRNCERSCDNTVGFPSREETTTTNPPPPEAPTP